TITGALTGGTSANDLFTTINHAVDGAGGSLFFANTGVANPEQMAGSAVVGVGGGIMVNSMVNVASATTLPQALDLAASQAALAVNPNPNTTTFGQIPANTGVIDWFQFGGNTYIVEANNTGNTPAAHTALGATDAVVLLTGLVDLGAGGGGFAGHILTI